MKKIVSLIFLSLVFVSLGILILFRHKNLDQFEIGLTNIILFGFAMIVFLDLLSKEIPKLTKTKDKKINETIFFISFLLET